MSKARRITCGGCPTTWTGLATAHCGACHETFGSVSGFDLHRSQEGEHGACIDPHTIGRLHLRDGKWRIGAMSAQDRARVAKA